MASFGYDGAAAACLDEEPAEDGELGPPQPAAASDRSMERWRPDGDSEGSAEPDARRREKRRRSHSRSRDRRARRGGEHEDRGRGGRRARRDDDAGGAVDGSAEGSRNRPADDGDESRRRRGGGGRSPSHSREREPHRARRQHRREQPHAAASDEAHGDGSGRHDQGAGGDDAGAAGDAGRAVEGSSRSDASGPPHRWAGGSGAAGGAPLPPRPTGDARGSGDDGFRVVRSSSSSISGGGNVWPPHRDGRAEDGGLPRSQQQPPHQPSASRHRLPALLREAVGTAASAIVRDREEAEAVRAAADSAVAAPARRRFVDDEGAGGGEGAARRAPSAAAQPPHDPLPAPAPLALPASSPSMSAVSALSSSSTSSSVWGAPPQQQPPTPTRRGHPPQPQQQPPPHGAAAVAPAWNSFLQGCRSVSAYRPLGKIDEGTYGEVFAAVDVETGVQYALKKVKMAAVSANEGFPITALRESNILLALGGAGGASAHPNIIGVREMVVGSSLDKVYMVMELMEHDLKAVFAAMGGCFTQAEVKCLLQQLLRGVAALHAAWVCHRDLKPSNLLCDNAGRLAICDFGMARYYGSPLKAYTQPVVTLWYRPPELLLGQRVYDGAAVDMFSCGCIFAELLTRRPLFRTDGGSDAEMLGLVFALLGTPTDESWPGWGSLPGAAGLARLKPRPPQSLRTALGMVGGGGGFGGTTSISDAGLELLRGLLALDPTQRLSAPEALAHRWFAESPPACDPALMPSFPSSSELKVAKQQRGGAARSPQPLPTTGA